MAIPAPRVFNSVHLPVTLSVIIDHGDPGTSRITIGGSNFGFGPIQSNHVRGKVTLLRQRIEQMAASN